MGKQVFHEKKKLNIIHDCQWPHWNSWSNVHLSFHLFSHSVGMYIYIHLFIYLYIGSLILEVFDFLFVYSVPAPIPTLFLPQEWPKIPSCAEFRNTVGWVMTAHACVKCGINGVWSSIPQWESLWWMMDMISHDIPWYPYSWSDCTHVLPNCNGDPLGTLEALWLTSGFLIWDAAMGILGCRCTSRILADSASKFMPHV